MSLKAPVLTPNDPVGIVAPSSAPLDPIALEEGLETLRTRGLRLIPGREELRPRGYLSGSDAERAEELNDFFRRDDVRAIFCVRGGFGLLRILPMLDFEPLREHPKLIVGYSDATALLLAAYRSVGLCSVAGPMVAVDWRHPLPDPERLFWELAGGATPQPLLGPGGEQLIPLRPGMVEGVLLGGNLTLITRLIGTPYLPSLDGAILFLEDVGEEPYRVDGLLAHLKLAGILDRLGGLLLGSFSEAEPRRPQASLTLDEVIVHYTRELPYPVASGLAFGHIRSKNSMPVGVRARLTVDQELATLDILEPVVF